MDLRLEVSQEIVTKLSRLDRFRGRWSAGLALPAPVLERMREAARVQSVGASCRLSGIRVSDHDVAAVLRGGSLASRDADAIQGYAAAISWPFPDKAQLMTEETLRKLHAVMMGAGPEAAPSPWRQRLLDRQPFDAEGRATGRVFATLPPHLVEEKTQELLTWLELELRAGEQHPVLVIAAFLLYLLASSPFERGNGRLVRLLAPRLLERAGYDYMPYASLETQMEQLREEYYEAFDKAHTRIWTGEADLSPWLQIVLHVLDHHRERVEAKVELERRVGDYPPLQQAILQTVREHGSANAALLIEATGANRNTLKDNLRRLVERGVLEKSGERRGTRYRMATGERPRPAVMRGDH
jgi:Fic family protein